MRLDQLKIGDKVAIPIIAHGFSNVPRPRYQIATIAKETDTQFTTATGHRFRKADGFLIGGNRFSPVEVATDELIAETERLKSLHDRTVSAVSAMYKMKDELDRRSLSLEQMEAIVAAYKQIKEQA